MNSTVYTLSYLAGLVSFLSPCIIPMISVYFSLITGMSVKELRTEEKNKAVRVKIILNTILFIAAFTLVFTAAGAVSGKASGFIRENVQVFNFLGGIMVVLLALKMLGLFQSISLRIKFLDNLFDKFRNNASTGYITTFFVGVFFAIACSHCIGPLLYSMLIFAGNTGSAQTGMLTMLMFSLGLGTPYLFMGIAFGRAMGALKRLRKYHRLISCITGSVLLMFGLLLLFNKFTLIVEILYKLLPFKINNSFGM